jgi:hypothetical protein
LIRVWRKRAIVLSVRYSVAIIVSIATIAQTIAIRIALIGVWN